MKAEGVIEIEASPERIWPFLVDPKRILEWCITFRKFEYSGEQHSGTGTPIYLEEEAGGRLMKMHFVVTEWAPNEKVAFRMTSGDFLKGYEQSWTVQAAPSGSRFTFGEHIDLPYGIIGKAMGLVAERQSQATVGQMLGKLKDLVEVSTPAAV